MQPRVLITLGDVAGIGPEVLLKAWPELLGLCRPIVVGDRGWLQRTSHSLALPLAIESVADPSAAHSHRDVVCVLPGSGQDLRDVEIGKISPQAGRAAYDFLIRAIDLTLAGQADAIVTLPLHKEGLRAAGIAHPGHTEILAERTAAPHHAMMLYARGPSMPQGLGVVHVTLHMALRNVFSHLSTAAIVEKIRLLHGVLAQLNLRMPRLAVAALNPHASDGGLFGDEEKRIIAPAVAQARQEDIDVQGPLPADTLFVQAQSGRFDGVVAMYHDQGHIALKLLSGLRAVNITLGLPLVRTSVAHGTAYDIAGQGCADAGSLVEAVRVAALLCGKE